MQDTSKKRGEEKIILILLKVNARGIRDKIDGSYREHYSFI